jgi:hypothetical protein
VGSGVRPVSRASGNRSSSVARVTGRATVHIPVRASPDPSLAVWPRAGPFRLFAIGRRSVVGHRVVTSSVIGTCRGAMQSIDIDRMGAAVILEII